jgi:TonB family protein
VYPEKARMARVEGEVEVCFNIDRFGRTKGVSVRRSTNRVFEKPARDAVRASTFHPLEPGQKVPDIKNCRTFQFALERVAVDQQ